MSDGLNTLDHFDGEITQPLTYFKRVVSYAFPISIVLSAAASFIFYHDYESEFLTAESAIELDVVLALINSALLSGLSGTILLCQKKRIANSLVRVFFSWFLLPASWMIFVLLVGFKDSLDDLESFTFTGTLYVTMYGPFLVMLIITFRDFKKERPGLG